MDSPPRHPPAGLGSWLPWVIAYGAMVGATIGSAFRETLEGATLEGALWGAIVVVIGLLAFH